MHLGWGALLEPGIAVGSSESLFPWLADDHILAVSSHGLLFLSMHPGVSPRIYKNESHWIRDPPSQAHFNLITSLKTLSLNMIIFSGSGSWDFMLGLGV